MTTAPTPDYAALLHRQGRAWIAKLAALEHWPETQAADELAVLQAIPGPDLPSHVETLRGRMWSAMENAGALPKFQRHHHADRPREQTPPRRRARGLARHLYDED